MKLVKPVDIWYDAARAFELRAAENDATALGIATVFLLHRIVFLCETLRQHSALLTTTYFHFFVFVFNSGKFRFFCCDFLPPFASQLHFPIARQTFTTISGIVLLSLTLVRLLIKMKMLVLHRAHNQERNIKLDFFLLHRRSFAIPFPFFCRCWF